MIRAELGGWSRDGIVRQAAFKGIEEGRDPPTVDRETRGRTAAAVRDAEADALPADGRRCRTCHRTSEEPEDDGDRRSATAPATTHEFPWQATDDELAALDALGKEGVWKVGGNELKLTNLDKALFEARPAGHQARAHPLLRPDRADDAAAPRGSPAQPPALPERRRRARLLAEGHPGDRADLADPLARDRGRRPRGPRRQRPPHRRPRRDPVLARQPGQLRDPRLDRAPARRRGSRRSRSSTSTPATTTTWDETLILARLYRTALGHLGVRGYPKTTGKRGIQVWIPIVPKYAFAETSAWVEKVSRAVGATVPDLVSWEWAKGARKGRARLDYTQNASIKTLVAPYSVRPARRRAGVRADRLGRAGRPRRSGRTAGRSGRSSSGWRRSATCSPTPRPTPRSSRPSDRRAMPRARLDGVTWHDCPMNDDTIELRQPAGDPVSLRAYVAPIAAAFGETIDDAEFDADLNVFEADRAIGALDGEAWVGGGAAYSFRLTVPGRREVGAAGITGVGVRPDYRRRGILTRMMGWLLDQAAERGEPVAVLRASEGAIYPHFGFGLATLEGSFDMERADLRFTAPPEPLGQVRLVDLDEAMGIIPDLYDRVRLDTPGQIGRSAAKWRAQMLADLGTHHGRLGPKSRAVLEVDGEARAYALLPHEGGLGRPRAAQRDHRDGGHRARPGRGARGLGVARRDRPGRAGQGVADARAAPAGPRLRDLRRMGVSVADGLWLRLVDLAGALEGRSYEGSAVTIDRADRRVPARQCRSVADRGHRRIGRRHPDDRPGRPRARHGGSRSGLPRGVPLRRPAPGRTPDGVPAGCGSGRRPGVRDARPRLELHPVLSRPAPTVSPSRMIPASTSPVDWRRWPPSMVTVTSSRSGQLGSYRRSVTVSPSIS